MPVPIAFKFDDYPTMVKHIWVDSEMVEVEIPLPAEPEIIEFNYQHGVLAHVR